MDLSLDWVSSPARWAAAAAVVLAWTALCLVIWRRWRLHGGTQTGAATTMPGEGRAASAVQTALWVIHASQTGQAEDWARRSAGALQGAGQATRLVRLDQIGLAELQQHAQRGGQAAFVVSTTGEGEAPDQAQAFARHLNGRPAVSLAGLRYGLMALGDRHYTHFCGFGRRLDAWLREAGGTPLFDRIEVDQADPACLAQWQRELARVAGVASVAGVEAVPASPAPEPGAGHAAWTLAARRCLNPGSPGEAAFELRLQPAGGAALPAWQAGDLVQILPVEGAADRRARDYSIANLPADGHVRLLVRRQVRADGRTGLVSGWLCDTLAPGQTVQLRVRTHEGFHHDGASPAPLILIGSGTGLAGLRAHLQQRAAHLAATGQRPPARCAWLIFGERSPVHDRWLDDELQAWRESGLLSELDLCHSRDETHPAYVQDRLRQRGARLREWIAAGASVLVCGSRAGMATGVDEALRELLGCAAVDELMRTGRLRRDVY